MSYTTVLFVLTIAYSKIKKAKSGVGQHLSDQGVGS